MSKMRICVNGMTENNQIRGPVRYIYEIVANMPVDKFDIFLIAGKWQKDIYGPLEKKVKVVYFDINRSKVSRALFFMFYMPWFLKLSKIDLYHIPDTNPIPIVKGRVQIVSTVHDCAEYVVPHRFSYIQSFYRRVISRLQVKFSDIVITVSHSSKDDILKYHNLLQNKVVVIYNGVTKIIDDKIELEGAATYILYVGVLEREKNVEKLVEAFALLDKGLKQNLKLYLVGRKGNGYEEVQQIINKYSLFEKVVLFGYVDDRELKRLYTNALIFAYLSEYEGFGLPVLEAMQYGVPVITTNKSSLKEVAGNAALLTDTTIDEIKNNLTLLLMDKEKRQYYSRLGIDKAKEYSWQKAASDTGELYSSLFHKVNKMQL